MLPSLNPDQFRLTVLAFALALAVVDGNGYAAAAAAWVLRPPRR